MPVVSASSPGLLREFIDLPAKLYAGDPCWVPPYRPELAETFDRRRNPFFRVAEIEHFLAVDARGRAVGRVAACVHHAYNRCLDRRHAFFGFFESVPDGEVAGALLSTVEEWAAARGLDTVAGPYSYCPTQEAGLLVEGFDGPPALLQTYNPPYYERLIRDAGYERSFTIQTFSGEVDALRDRTGALIEQGRRVARAHGLTVRPLDRSRLDAERTRLLALFNDAFSRNRDVVPIEDEVFRFQTAALEAIVDPRLVLIAERDGAPVGFVLALPNFNEVLLRYRGRITLPMLLKRRAVLRSIRSAVIVLIGARREAHGLGLSRVLLGELLKQGLGAGYERFHSTWVDEQNGAMLSGIRRFRRSRPDKRYGIYRKALAAAR
ncbi:MAG TPA: GNAT family N-acetyltransferase [Vicinamibacterales bacterium]|nr:GNAT family N-acetyltransferase [Vicinamibacterales bacterium]